MVNGNVKSLTQRKILGEADKQKERPHGFDDESEKKDRFQDHEEVAAGGVHEHGLDDFSFLKGDPPAHDAEEKNRKGDDSEATDLKKNHRHDLTGEGEIFADVDGGKACDADSRRGHEQRVNESQRVLGG